MGYRSDIVRTSAVLALLLPLPAWAGQVDQQASADASPPVVATPMFGGTALNDGSLAQVAGREDVAQISHADQVAGVSQNSVGDNARTGEARIADNAFQNMSGLSILNVNTGNNVAINAAMNVNISLTPAP